MNARRRVFRNASQTPIGLIQNRFRGPELAEIIGVPDPA